MFEKLMLNFFLHRKICGLVFKHALSIKLIKNVKIIMKKVKNIKIKRDSISFVGIIHFFAFKLSRNLSLIVLEIF